MNFMQTISTYNKIKQNKAKSAITKIIIVKHECCSSIQIIPNIIKEINYQIIDQTK